MKNVKGFMLIGIFATWILGIICQLTGLYVVDAQAGSVSLIPSFEMTDFSKLGKTFGECFNVDFDGVSIINFIVVIFSFLFVDIFDTLGTLIGVCTKADMLDKDGKLPAIKPALLADSVATTAGAVLGTSTTTTFVESSAGVAAGGRTGLSAVVTAVMFLISMLFAVICNSSCTRYLRIPYVQLNNTDKVHRGKLSQVHSGISLYTCHAAVLQHF